MRFICDSCSAQYMISDDKVGAKGAKVRCKKCGHVILVHRPQPSAGEADPWENEPLAMTRVVDPSAGLPEDQPEDKSAPPSSESDAPKGKHLSGAQILSGVEDEEIGAVFDHALGAPDQGEAPSVNGAPAQSQTLKELASEAASPSAPSSASQWIQAQAGLPRADMAEGAEAANYEWYVAIDNNQVGPSGLDKLKALWDSGEIGPDSLCWRAGLADWMPLSEVKELSSVLAPRPARPVIIVPSFASTPAVTAPVESVLTGSSRPTPAHLHPTEPTGPGWRPSAATTLASLMKEEIDALSTPGAKAATAEVAPPSPPTTSQLMDTLPGPAPLSASLPMSSGHYVPVRRQRKGWIIGLGVGVVLLVAVAVLGTLLLTRPAATARPEVVQAGPPVAPPRAYVPPTPPPVEPTRQLPPPVVQKQEEVHPPPVNANRPEATGEVGRAEPGSSRSGQSTGKGGRTRMHASREKSSASRPAEEKPEVISRKEPPAPAEDEFDREFGGSSGTTPAAKPDRKGPRSVYVPPAPGTVDLPESLGQSDIMQVVVSNKPAILTCVAEQKKRDPGLSGKIVMRWTIHTNGRASNVSCQSDEFKGTYVASCIAGLIKNWSFPKHKVQGEAVNFPFTF